MLTFNRGYRGWASLSGAFVSVLLGVGIVALTGLLYTSGTPPVPARFVNAPIVVSSRPTTAAEQFPPTRPWSAAAANALADRLERLPGIDDAIPDRTFYAQVVRDGRVTGVGEGQTKAPDPDRTEGHNWSSTVLGDSHLVAGAAPERPGKVALDRGLGFPVGARITLLTASGPAPYLVSGLLDRPGLYLADAEAERLAPGVRAIGLIGEPTAAVLAEVTNIVHGDGQVLTGAGRSALEPRGDANTRWIGSQLLAGMAALATFVSVFVVASTFALNVNQRRREFGLLRVIGAAPRQVKRLLYHEALTVAVAAAAIGVVLGALSAPLLARVLVNAEFEPASYQVRLRWWPLAAAFLVGPVVAVAGVWSAARRASRVRPLETLREAAVETRPMTRVRWLVGGLFGAGGIAGVLGAAASDDTGDMATLSLVATMALVVAATVLAPAVVPAFVRLVTWPLVRTRGAAVMLVRQNALTAVRRTAATAAPVLLTVTFAVLVTGNVQTATAAYAGGRADAVLAGTVLVPDGTPGLSDAAVAAATAAPQGAGTPSSAALLETTAYLGDAAMPALGVDPAAFRKMSSRLTVLSGDLADLSGDDTVVATQSTARDHGWRQGEIVTVVLADGSGRQRRLVAIVSDQSAPANLLFDRTALRRHDPSALTSAVFLSKNSAGASSGSAASGSVSSGVVSGGDQVASGEQVAGGAAIGARVVDVATYAAEADAAEDRLVWLFALLLVGVSAGYGAIAVASTLFMAAAARRRDFRVLWLSGASRRQVCFMVAAESAVVVGLGSVLGGAIAFIALLGGVAALREQVGASVDVVVPWATIGAVVATCLTLAVIASVLPVSRAWRHP